MIRKRKKKTPWSLEKFYTDTIPSSSHQTWWYRIKRAYSQNLRKIKKETKLETSDLNNQINITRKLNNNLKSLHLH